MNINLLIIFIIGQAICLANAYFLSGLMAKDDAIEIELNGRFDSLKDEWHQTSAKTRALIFGSLATLALLPVAIGGHWIAALLVAVTFAGFSLSIHWNRFDALLNKFRNLPKGYLGQNAKLDIFLKVYDASQIVRLKKNSLIATGLAYSAAVALLIFRLQLT